MRWHTRGVRNNAVTSGEMLQRLWSLTPSGNVSTGYYAVVLLVVSERLAHRPELGWQDIKVADNADNDALLRITITHTDAIMTEQAKPPWLMRPWRKVGNHATASVNTEKK